MREAAYLTITKIGVVIETPYREGFVQAIKARTTTRKWDGEKRAWIVGLPEHGAVCELVKAHYKDMSVYLVEGAIVTELHSGEVTEQVEIEF